MKDSVVSNSVDEFSSVLVDLGNQAPLLTPSPQTPVSSPDITSGPATPVPSYQPYPWSALNQVLDLIDKKSNGRAGLLQRVISYLFFGGVAALVNLAVFYIMYYHVLTPLVAKNATVGNILSYIVAAELSIIANFIPNDRFTFNKLPGARRPWLQRSARFHMTCIVGSCLTFLIELALSTFTHTQPIFAEAIATLLVLIYNFTFHHVFTYRHVKHA
jgi:putative flippase GtrA